MKTATLLCLLFMASLTWGQYVAPSIVNGAPQPLHQFSNPQHADIAPMRQQQNLLGSSNSTSAKGERPLWEVAPQEAPVSLGDVARAYRKQREAAKKASFMREN